MSCLLQQVRPFTVDVLRLNIFTVSKPAPDLWTWLKSLTPFPTLIDIGANDGSFGRFLVHFLNVEKAFFFEPQKALHAQIEGQDLCGAESRLFDLALSDSDGEVEFYENSNHPSSSLLPVTEHSKREFPQTSGESVTRVRTARLDDALPEADLFDKVFIKIDVQGVEDKVIRGGERTFRRASFVLIEMSFVPFYEGQPLFEEVHEQLRQLGFRFVGIKNQIESPQNGRPLFCHCLYQNTKLS